MMNYFLLVWPWLVWNGLQGTTWLYFFVCESGACYINSGGGASKVAIPGFFPCRLAFTMMCGNELTAKAIGAMVTLMCSEEMNILRIASCKFILH